MTEADRKYKLRYLKKYPADKNVIYATLSYLAIINFEQISDEKKDIKTYLKGQRKQIDLFIRKRFLIMITP